MPSNAGTRELDGAAAVREALEQALERDPRVVLIGEGVPDPKGIFGTTTGLRERFGPDRVHDMPLSEGGMTGVCVGAALSGLRPVMVHQRIDFALLAMDQLVNNAAKWYYMFGGRCAVPLVVRLVVGRGWGQGPQHSQSLQALFAHVPGLKVVLPATPADLKGMLLAAVEDPNPVLFIEHRWLHGVCGPVDRDPIPAPLEGARVVRAGADLTVAAFSYMVTEALEAASALATEGIGIEIVDLRCASPLDVAPVLRSVRRTGRLAVLDTGWRSGGLSAEVVARVSEQAVDALVVPPVRIALPDGYVPTAPSLAAAFYPDARAIARALCDLMGPPAQARRERVERRLRREGPADVPPARFTGPF